LYGTAIRRAIYRWRPTSSAPLYGRPRQSLHSSSCSTRARRFEAKRCQHVPFAYPPGKKTGTSTGNVVRSRR
jgi:hypothetical protein